MTERASTRTEPSAGGEGFVRTVALLYALAGGVVWWAIHLVTLAVLTPAVCGGTSGWLFTLVNGVTFLGVLSALATSVWVRSPTTEVDRINHRSSFLGTIAILFNLASLALVVLESVPVYVLGPCS